MADTPFPSDSDFSARRAEMIHSDLAAGYPGRPCLSPGCALAIIDDAARNPDDAARQRLDRGTFPFPTILVAGRRLVTLVDIARVLAAAPTTAAQTTAAPQAVGILAANDSEPPLEPRRGRRGRRRKIAPMVLEQETAQ